MLQIKSISKEYVTGELHQTALDKVSLSLRDNEFVAILGPSGSGKTTLLNIIGGLDRYDSGDLIINGVSTKKYKDRDWDSYRNHTIGFVFQSYNLIPHQSILANVELALTISGISRRERRRRARLALEEVGLGDQLHKRPNQLSGGQMQRVAIARALVNDPDILLADEPTGALDTETSVQVMELLGEVARDRLVVMVTHNPELAEQYATRIVRLRDGSITDDSDPYTPNAAEQAEPQHRSMGHASMSRLTALSLSFNNLRTKKARTLLTSFAGSIGIIGIALILSLSTGVNTYIEELQRSTMTSYPITLQAQSMDLSSILASGREEKLSARDGELEHARDGVYSDPGSIERASAITTSLQTNDLTRFKQYLDNADSEIHQYIGENGIVYSYSTKFSIYSYDPEGTLVNTDGSTLTDAGGSSSGMGVMSMIGGSSSSNGNFEELLPGQDGALISSAVTDSYDLLYGTWPSAYDELVLVLDKDNEISATTLYQLGVLPTREYRELMRRISAGEEVSLEAIKWSYEDICRQELYLVPTCDTFVENERGLFDNISGDKAKLEELVRGGVPLKIVGVIRPAEEADYAGIGSALAYTKGLTDYLIEYSNASPVVTAQLGSPDRSVLNGAEFSPADDAARVADTKAYIAGLTERERAEMCRELLQQVYGNDQQSAQMLSGKSDAELAVMLDRYIASSEDTALLAIYDSYISAGSYDDDLAAFGYVSLDAPSSISIYADSFEDKDAITACISSYNDAVAEEDRISYTDYVGLLMSSVTTIVDVISYVLIAFVAVSLVVSSIMIGIITYISVLERTKEIGILRAIGASRRNISQVFNAETFIIGLCSGLIGIGLSLLALIPGNAVIHAVAGTTAVNARLPLLGAILLIALSVVLTLIGGLIPASKAAGRDPVTALRSE